MSIWLHKRLVIWMGVSLCGGALLWNVGALQAQNTAETETPRRKLSRDEAAKLFTSYFYAKSSDGAENSIAGKSYVTLGPNMRNLLSKMEEQWLRPNPTVRVQSEGEKTATVTVDNEVESSLRALILIEEDGSWGVDLVETYAKWNNLKGAAKAEAIFKLTGAVLDELPPSEARDRKLCQTNLHYMSLALLQYAEDHDGKYPSAKDWIGEFQQYFKSEATYNCPAIVKGARYGYAYNSKLSNKAEKSLSDASIIVSFYETSILKRNAYGSGENLAFRHQNGANYAFADGHVKWFPKTQIPSFKLKP